MTDILVKYYAGDQDLMEAALANRRSQSPVAVMARAALHADEALLQAQERLSALDAQSAHTTGVKLDNVRKFTEVMGMIDPEWVKDARLKLQLADWAKNCAFKTVLALTAGDDEASTQHEAISVSEVAKAMGVTLSRSQLITVGKRVAQAYRDKYDGQEPSAHKQWVDGAVRMVKSYTERDRALIVDAIQYELYDA